VNACAIAAGEPRVRLKAISQKSFRIGPHNCQAATERLTQSLRMRPPEFVIVRNVRLHEKPDSEAAGDRVLDPSLSATGRCSVVMEQRSDMCCKVVVSAIR
jgi:hypothetical protein